MDLSLIGWILSLFLAFVIYRLMKLLYARRNILISQKIIRSEDNILVHVKKPKSMLLFSLLAIFLYVSLQLLGTLDEPFKTVALFLMGVICEVLSLVSSLFHLAEESLDDGGTFWSRLLTDPGSGILFLLLSAVYLSIALLNILFYLVHILA